MKRTVPSLLSRLLARVRHTAAPNRSRNSKLRFDTLEQRVVPANTILTVGTDAGAISRFRVVDPETNAT